MTPIIWYPGHDLLIADIVRAENCRLFDARGNEYIDLESGVWCTPIGHAHPRIVRVLQEQSALISHSGFGYTHPIVAEAGEEILSLLDFHGGKCVFLCSGSEAVEYGVRFAKESSSRPLIMTMTDSYFGAYGSASERRESDWFCFDWMDCAECPDSMQCDENCKRWTSIPHDCIGGFLFEPGSSSGLVRFPPEKLIRSIVHTVKEANGLIVVNEVTTGTGRTGKWFGHQHYGISPDIVAMGKGIGNGYPVSVTALAPGVIDRLGGMPLKYAQSHQNDPLGAAVALEVVRTINEERLIERSREISHLLVTGLNEIKSRNDRIKEIRSRGLMVAVDLVDDAATSYTASVQKELMQRGFVLARRPGLSTLRLDPALTIERDNIEQFLREFKLVLSDL